MQPEEKLALHAEIEAAALMYADALFEPMAKQITDDLNEKVVESFNRNLDGDYIRDIILPLFKRELFSTLATKCSDAAGGWDSVHWTNIHESYNQGTEA
jgi:hypothetical protein